MKVMLIEDNDRKRREISSHLISKGISEKDIIVAKTMTDFASLLSADIGLFVIDFYLPSLDGGEAKKNGKEILQTIIKSGKNNSLLVAISSYPDEFPELRADYQANGCILSDFNDKKTWKSTLDHLVIQLKKDKRFDFLIFCALKEERSPYALFSEAQRINIAGIDCLTFEVEGKKGAAILLPQMGLVNAAITASRCIERFRPKLVAMSGICGGFEFNANLGQLLISSMVYEYQSGKWSEDGFINEPYQVSTDHMTMVKLDDLIESEGLLASLEEGFSGRKPDVTSEPKKAVFTSGSAVIADQKFLNQISSIHRKVSALDMEVFAIHRAAELSPNKPPCICAKVVVDLCGKEKNDEFHSYGNHISAKFIMKSIKNFFSVDPQF